MLDTTLIKQRFEALAPILDERMRRLWAAAEAKAIGHGGIRAVQQATGVSHRAIGRGLKELESGECPPPGRVRLKGKRRATLEERDPTLLSALENLVAPTTRGDPMSPLRWTCKSLRVLAVELARLGHPVSHTKVGEMLRGLGYSLRGNAKVLEGDDHPDRDAQFRYINDRAQASLAAGQPVISVDTKKKELIGNFKNAGAEWQPEGEPDRVDVHDFPDDAVGKAIPYGVYDVAANDGFVNVGTDHDTPVFAVTSIKMWWMRMGAKRYPGARELYITADAGGSNGYRLHAWKVQLQRLADELHMSIHVSHFPPGTSKWNKIEHRLFSFITMNWRGRPLRSYETIVSLIGNTTTYGGLAVRAQIDRRKYPTGRKVAAAELRALNIERDEFHGD